MEIIYENKEICKSCGGKCCKKSGCDYGTNDFKEITINYLEEELRKGFISIVSFQNFKCLPNGKIINIPFLYLRARNINRPIVDLLSFKTTCKSLTLSGCKYNIEDRPSGGINLIPCNNQKCYPLEEPIKILEGWKKYQKVLTRLVKRLTGNSINVQISIDVENLIYDCLCHNFDNVLKIEIEDVLEMLPTLIKAYPEETKQAKKRFNNEKKLRYKK